MTSNKMFIRELKRVDNDGNQETLEFTTGINLIIGDPNTGKTKWMQMLDYLMGGDSTAEKTFGEALARKYTSIEGIFSISGMDYHIYRTWKKYGFKTKMLINDVELPVSDFSHFVLEKLNIPILSYPKGNPYRGTWPHLSWRNLYRHVYRQQRFWGDLADKQPETDQHACLLLYLGIAEHLYSELYGELIAKRKRVYELEGAKTNFLNILGKLVEGIIDNQDLRITVTLDSINKAIEAKEQELSKLYSSRLSIIEEIINHNSPEQSKKSEVQALTEKNAKLIAEEENIITKIHQAKIRYEELVSYEGSLAEELSKLSRVSVIGSILSDIKITHCPACDQEVVKTKEDEENCFLCHQHLPSGYSSPESKETRLQFERKQITDEHNEVKQLRQQIEAELDSLSFLLQQHRLQLREVGLQLQPYKASIATAIPTELTNIDVQVGRVQEKIGQLERIKNSLELREQMTSEIDSLQRDIAGLEGEVKKLGMKVNYEQSADWMSDGMNTYLSSLFARGKKLWSQRPVSWRIRERNFSILIGNDIWSKKIGGTLTLYFLFAYHFALLALSEKAECHYPGFAIFDLPASLDDGTKVSDKESYVLEPFVELLNKNGMEETQIIATGSSFEGLENANKIFFEDVWSE